MTQLQFDATVLPNGVLTIPLPIQWQSRNVKVIVEAEESTESPSPLPEGFNPMMLGIIDTKMYGSVKVIGDIIAPIDEKWEALQ